MTKTDQQILALLQDNARLSITEIAQALHISRTTVQKRLAVLENEGTITGYTLKLKPNFDANTIRAWMSIAVEGSKMKAVILALRRELAVAQLHSTNGKWDLAVELKAESLEAFDQALGRIRLINGISSTETSLLLSTYKH